MNLRLSGAMILCLIMGSALRARPVEPSVPAGPHSLDLAQYVAELENDSTAARRLKEHPAEAAGLEKELPTVWVVAASGQRYTVTTDWLRERLNALESDPGRAAEISGELVARLEAMRAAAQAMTPAPLPTTVAARSRLDNILKRREYRGVAGPNPLRTWWDRITDWIAEKLSILFGKARHHETVSTILVWLLAAGVILLLVVWLVRSALRISTGTSLKLESPPLPERGDWARQALACADRGDYREAIHLAYGLALARFEENGLWQLNAAHTPREYLRLVPREHVRRRPLAALTRRFERAWYGGKAVSQEDFRGALVELGDLGCPLAWNQATANSF